MSDAVRLLIVPRWGGTADHDFYPWLRERARAHGVATTCLTLDHPPTITHALAELVPWLEQAPGSTIVLGHSVGAQAVMRALAASRRATPLAGFVAVAGWFSVDRPWPTIVPWLETPFDHAAARAAVTTARVVLSDDDPFTADARATRRMFEDRLGAAVEVVAGGKHFNGTEEPAVLRTVLSLLAIDGSGA